MSARGWVVALLLLASADAAGAEAPASAPAGLARVRGLAFLAVGELDEAVRALRAAVAEDPADDVARYHLGAALLRGGAPGDRAEARALLGAVADRDGAQAAAALVLLAGIAARDGERAAAVAFLKRADARAAAGGDAALADEARALADAVAGGALEAAAGAAAPVVPRLWFARFEIGGGGDSNPTLEPADLFAGTAGAELHAAAAGGLRPIRGRRGALELSASVFQSWHPAPRPELAPYDATGLRAALGGALAAGPLRLRGEAYWRDLWTELFRTHFATTFGVTLEGVAGVAGALGVRVLAGAAATDFIDVSPPDAAGSPDNRDAVHLLARAGPTLARGRFVADAYLTFETDLAEGDSFDWIGGGGGLAGRFRDAAPAHVWIPAEAELAADLSVRDYPRHPDARRDLRVVAAARAGWRVPLGVLGVEMTYLRSFSIPAYDHARLAGGITFRIDL